MNEKVTRKWSSDPHRPRVMRSRSRGRRRSVGRGSCGPGIQPRKKLTPGRRRRRRKRKAPSSAPMSRGVPESRAVRDPEHVRRHLAREPGDPKSALGGRGISRFPHEVSTYVHGVSDRAGFSCTSRYRCMGKGLPLSPTASASRRKFLTRLNTRPARSPVNASTPPLRAAPYDSGPMWVATSHSCDFFIHYTSPV